MPKKSRSGPKARSQPPPASPGEKLTFPVVGVGASAGGLEALREMLAALPADTGMAYVLVSHLDPHHPSMLSEILARESRMPVQEITPGTSLQPNQVYVIPPARDVLLSEGVLQLSARSEGQRVHRPIDPFFRSLADELGHLAIGVVLSGTANDGTQGCEEIKAAGGITFAQDETAQHESMPKSAAEAGCIDFVLAPKQIAAEIARIGRHPYVAATAEQPALRRRGELQEIMELLHRAVGVDFTHYKLNTLYRRVTRRMVLHRLENLKEYLRMLQDNPTEIDTLFQDILINVTSFFRNPDGFDALKAEAFPRLVADRPRHVPVRIWVLGCSTGEEAYSLAMAFAEYLEASGRNVPLQIFASDLNNAGVEKARAGIYGKSIVDDVSPERLRRFFVEIEGGYRISKAIREQVIFARHNVLTDPPFSQIDLVSCRNMLIYLEQNVQQRVLSIIHYALKPQGMLWLGQSETIGPFHDLFDNLEAKHKLYLKRPIKVSLAGFPLHPPTREPRSVAEKRPERPGDAAVPILEGLREADRLMLLRYTPAAVLVNPEMEILQFRGDTSPYLSPSPGKASLNLLKMLREGLLVGVRGAMQRARRTDATVREEGLRVRVGTKSRTVHVEVIPVRGASLRDAAYLVVFEPVAQTRRGKPQETRPAASAREAAAEASRLRQELAASREYLQSVIEQQEAANEELQSANEEVQSTNEELQSINEEMETSKEEIQSSNEELATVNDELSTRNRELAESNNDLLNLIGSVQIALVMLGPDLRIRRVTPSAQKLLNLIAADVGRPISDIKLNLDVPNLEQLVTGVIETITPVQLDTRDKDGRWYSLRLRPYRTLENKIEGAVLLLVDVDDIKRGEQTLRTSAERLRIMQDKAPVGIYEVDQEGRFLRVNDRFCEITGYSREELLQKHAQDLVHPDEVAASLQGWQRLKAGETPVFQQEKRYQRRNGGVVWVELHASLVRDPEGKPQFGVGIVLDITQRRHSLDALRESEARFRELANTAPVLIWVHGIEGAEFVNQAFLEYLGVTEQDFASTGWIRFVHPDDRDAALEQYRAAFAGRRRYDAQYRLRRVDGEYRWMKTVGVPRYVGGEFAGLLGSSFDVTDLKQAAEVLHEADRTKNEFIAVLAHELRNPLAPLRNVVHLLRAPDAGQTTLVEVRDLMERQIQTIARMVDDLLDISRITQGKIRLQPEPVELSALLARTVEQHRSAFEARGQSLEVEIFPDHVLLEADPVRLEQIVSNLLTNALKFTRRGGHVAVSSRVVTNGGSAGGHGQMAEIRVRDDGAGMDPEVLPKVFDPFVQADRSLARSQGGLGIGLTLVRNLVELHGGFVEAVSAGPGKGSEFVVRLPIQTTARSATEERPSPGQLPAMSGQPRRILVVDDNVDAGDSLAMILAQAGHNVEVAREGEGAIALAQAQQPEIVLLDVGLPDRDGYQVARELRRLPHMKTAMLVGISGYGQPEDRYRAREAGFDHYFTKPVNLASLGKILALPLRPS